MPHTRRSDGLRHPHRSFTAAGQLVLAYCADGCHPKTYISDILLDCLSCEASESEPVKTLPILGRLGSSLAPLLLTEPV